jgi:hypothetical protein
MTLEQANEAALAAAEAGDLDALDRALHQRALSLLDLKKSPPSIELAGRMEEALRAGESISRALSVLKKRLGYESARLVQLESGLTAGLGYSRKTRIDCRG